VDCGKEEEGRMMAEDDQAKDRRIPYEPPALHELGTLVELTEAGGSSLPTEVIFPNSSQS
jgi:hypothetical protein